LVAVFLCSLEDVNITHLNYHIATVRYPRVHVSAVVYYSYSTYYLSCSLVFYTIYGAYFCSWQITKLTNYMLYRSFIAFSVFRFIPTQWNSESCLLKLNYWRCELLNWIVRIMVSNQVTIFFITYLVLNN